MSIVPYTPRFRPSTPFVIEVLRASGITPAAYQKGLRTGNGKQDWAHIVETWSADIRNAFSDVVSARAEVVRNERPIKPYVLGSHGMFLPEFTDALLAKISPKHTIQLSAPCMRALYEQARDAAAAKELLGSYWHIEEGDHKSLVLFVS